MVLCISYHYLLYNQNSDSENDSMFYSSSLNAKGTNPPEGFTKYSKLMEILFCLLPDSAAITATHWEPTRGVRSSDLNRCTHEIGSPRATLTREYLNWKLRHLKYGVVTRLAKQMQCLPKPGDADVTTKNASLNCRSSNLGTFLAHIVFI